MESPAYCDTSRLLLGKEKGEVEGGKTKRKGFERWSLWRSNGSVSLTVKPNELNCIGLM